MSATPVCFCFPYHLIYSSPIMEQKTHYFSHWNLLSGFFHFPQQAKIMKNKHNQSTTLTTRTARIAMMLPTKQSNYSSQRLTGEAEHCCDYSLKIILEYLIEFWHRILVLYIFIQEIKQMPTKRSWWMFTGLLKMAKIQNIQVWVSRRMQFLKRKIQTREFISEKELTPEASSNKDTLQTP